MTKTPSRSKAAFNSENIARRAFLQKSAGLAVLGVTIGGLQSARAQQKATQADVNYQDTPKDGQKCANCHFYDGESGCSVVEGEVIADAWCDVWVAPS